MRGCQPDTTTLLRCKSSISGVVMNKSILNFFIFSFSPVPNYVKKKNCNKGGIEKSIKKINDSANSYLNEKKYNKVFMVIDTLEAFQKYVFTIGSDIEIYKASFNNLE